MPYPLPLHDGSPGVSDKPVKVYILSGQSNMVGFGQVSGTAPGTLETITRRENKFPHFVDPSGGYMALNNVHYRGVASALGNGPLRPGFGRDGGSIGPELGFGHLMGWYHDEPVLVIKASVGNRGLLWDLLPPGSEQFDWTDGFTYPGYGESPRRWTTVTSPTSANRYAGRELNHWFMHPDDWAPPTGDPVPVIPNLATILDDFANEYPQWAAQGFEIAGFGWFQGYDDANANPSAATATYKDNMARFIREIRKYCETPPTPNPMSFEVAPQGAGTGSIGMRATSASDQSLPVEYYFENTTNGNFRHWSTSREWTNTGLTDGASHGYRVKARDANGLEGEWSAELSATAGVDTTAPTPNPMSFAAPPTALGETSITMTATTAIDLTAVEYRFNNLMLGTSSPWQDSPGFTATGLSPDTTYTFTVQARDKSPAQNTTVASAEAYATTDAPDTTPPAIVSLSPANGANNAQPDTALIMTFDEIVQKGTGSIVVRTMDGNAFATIDAAGGNVTLLNGIVTITLPAALDPRNPILRGSGSRSDCRPRGQSLRRQFQQLDRNRVHHPNHEYFSMERRRHRCPR